MKRTVSIFAIVIAAVGLCSIVPAAATGKDTKVRYAASCTVQQCIKAQMAKGYTKEQASNWCPKNMHRNSACN